MTDGRAGRGRRGRWLVAAAAVGLGLLAAPAGAQELHGLITGTYSLTNTRASGGTGAETTTEFSNLSETFDLSWNKRVTPVLGYRLTLRGEHLDGSSTLKSAGSTIANDMSSTFVEPRLELVLSSLMYNVVLGYRLRELLTDTTLEGNYRVSERNPYIRLTYTPQDLPSLNFSYEQLSAYDDRDPQTRDEDNTRLNLAASYAWRGLTLSYNYFRETRDDNVRGTDRTQTSQTGSVGYQGTFLDNRLSLQGDVFLTQVNTVDGFSMPGLGEVSVPIATGLRAGADITPEDSSDVPMARDSALVTGGAAVPLPVFSAVGFGLSVPGAVSRLSVSLAADPPFTFPSNFDAFIAFRVFATDDPSLTVWTEVIGVAQSFDPTQNRISLTFPQTTARFFKAWVSRNDFGLVVRATRVEAGAVQVITSRTELSRTGRAGTINLAASYTPVPWLTVAYNSNTVLSEEDPPTGSTTRAASGTQTLTLTLRPHSTVTTIGTAQYSFAKSDQQAAQDTSQRFFTLVTTWLPLPTLTTGLTLSRSEQLIDSDLDVRTDTVALTAGARLYPGLTMDGTYTFGRAENFTSGQNVTGHDFALQAYGQLTERLGITANYGLQYRIRDPALPGQDETSLGNVIGVTLTYLLSRVVTFTGRWDYATSSDGHSFTQSYKLDWTPTAKTSVYMTASNTMATLGQVDTNSYAVGLNGRWSLTRIIDLNANYLYAKSESNGTSQSVQTLGVTASVRF